MRGGLPEAQLAITGVEARDIVGYTAALMLVAAGWMALGLLLL